MIRTRAVLLLFVCSICPGFAGWAQVYVAVNESAPLIGRLAPARAVSADSPQGAPPDAAARQLSGQASAEGAVPTVTAAPRAPHEARVISFDNASLSRVFRLLAEQADLDYVEPPLPEDEPISLHLRNTTPEAAFYKLAAIRGFKVYKVDGIITLRRPDLAVPTYVRMVKYPLNHVDAMWVVQGVAGLLGIKIEEQPKEVIPTYPTPRETFVGGGSSTTGGTGGLSGGTAGGATSSASTGTATGTGAGTGASGVAQPRWIPSLPMDTPVYVGAPRFAGDPETANAIFVDRKENALVVRTTEEMHESVAEYVRTLDKKEPQIIIDTRILELTLNKDLRQGMDWSESFGDGLRFRLTPSGANAASSAAFSTAPPTAGAATRFLLYPQSAILTYPEVSAVFRNLATNGNFSLVSQPRVVTRSGVPVYIQSTVEQSIEVFRTTGQDTLGDRGDVPQGTLQSGTEKFTTGVTLDVLPRLLEDNRVDLNINPTVSSRIGQTQGASGQLIPIISRRSATSTVTVESGMTVAIGGLLELRDSQNSSGIPPFNRIPLLGKLLFGRRSNESERKNLIIFVTPTVLQPTETVVVEAPLEEVKAFERAESKDSKFVPAPAAPAPAPIAPKPTEWPPIQ